MNRSLQLAYKYCRKIALGHYENFPVGSLLVPRRVRHDFYALYAYMRSADDFADEPHRSTAERLELLASWRAQLWSALAGGIPTSPIFVALQTTVRKHSLDPQLLLSLLDAFEFDAMGDVRFARFSDLRWYTARSADPVGRLVLQLFGYRSDELARLSDDICTALQLLNFIQDARADLENGRYYFPEEDLARYEIRNASDILGHPSRSFLMLHECDRVTGLLEAGSPLPEQVRGRLRYELRAVVLGANAMVKKIRDQEGDVFSARPTLSRLEHWRILLRALVGS